MPAIPSTRGCSSHWSSWAYEDALSSLPQPPLASHSSFILIAAATFGVSFLGFIAGYVLFGLGISLLILGVSAGGGLLTIYMKQKKGLHSKRRDKGVQHYHHLYER